MRRWRILAITVAAAMTAIPAASGQPARNVFAAPEDGPGYRYPVSPQAGEWLICVQTFKDDTQSDAPRQAQQLAQEMAELIMREYKRPAYLHVWGRKERLEEQKRIDDIRTNYNEMFTKMRADGLNPVGGRFTYKVPVNTVKEEYAVLMGKPNRQFKDIDAARDYLNDIRKLKPPPNQFCVQAVLGDAVPDGKRKINQSGVNYLNPFLTAMVVHNPAIAMQKPQNDPTKADDFLKEINSGETYNLLKCRKPWTLVVKQYTGAPMLVEAKNNGIMGKLGFGKKEGEGLNASAMQAHELADYLRKMKFDAYVMHHRQSSIVTIGEYDGKDDRCDDPKMLANQRALAGLQFKDQKTGIVIETLNPQPLPMRIPR